MRSEEKDSTHQTYIPYTERALHFQLHGEIQAALCRFHKVSYDVSLSLRADVLISYYLVRILFVLWFMETESNLCPESHYLGVLNNFRKNNNTKQ